MARQEAQAIRKPPLPTFDPGTEEGAANLEALGAYIQANGGGPAVPRPPATPCAATTRPAAASCSGSTARPATTSPGGAARCRRASSPRRSTRRRRARSTRRCSPARRTCRSSPTGSSPRGEEGHHRLHQVGRGRQQQPRRQPPRRDRPGVRRRRRLHRRARRTDRIRTVAGGQVMTTSHRGRADARRAGGHVPAGAGAARRRARRRRGRPQHAEVAGAGHPRRAARRARGRAVVHRSRRSSALAFLVCYLFWPFEYVAPGQPGYWCTPSTRR